MTPKDNNENKVEVRFSHVLGFCGPGAIVRAPDEYIVPRDTSSWVKKGQPCGSPLTNICQVLSGLSIVKKKLYPPPEAQILKENGQERIKGFAIPAVRFPTWTRCGKCGKLYRYPWSIQKTDRPVCLEKKCKGQKLVQVPWVLIHENGYLDDLPWHWLAHLYAKENCRDNENLYLHLSGNRRLVCTTCNAEFRFFSSAALSKIPFSNVNMRKQPWLSWKTNQVPSEEIKENPPIAVEIGDTRIYSASVKSCLVIPPESRRKGSVVDKLANMPEVLDEIKNKPATLREKVIKRHASDLGCSKDELEEAFYELEKGCDEYEPITPDQLREKEYAAFLTEITDFKEGEQFITCHKTRKWKKLCDKDDQYPYLTRIIQAVDTLIAVERLREIRVFKGFTRTGSGSSDNEKSENAIVHPDLEGKQDWLPALELWGEGIFFTIKEDHISRWEQHGAVKKRLEIIAQKLDRPCELIFRNPLPNDHELPRFMLLHTISHLLIRQLAYSAGYPAASLKERIYSKTPDNAGEPMAGILIYVAVPDKAGSLGGLFEQADPLRFIGLMDEIFKHAEWCSLDPVCSEHRGQGACGLNLAACHACALIPDTACDHENVLLDRTLISGTPHVMDGEGLKPFLDFGDQNSRD